MACKKYFTFLSNYISIFRNNFFNRRSYRIWEQYNVFETICDECIIRLEIYDYSFIGLRNDFFDQFPFMIILLSKLWYTTETEMDNTF